MSTRAIARTGAGGTAALALTQIGADITLPAGGPWTVFGLWGQVAKLTTVPNEGSGGDLVVRSVSGDLTPDPAPGNYPLIGSHCTESANDGMVCLPLNIWPVNWQASGKSIISLSYRNELAITTGSQVACGILFGDNVPDYRPLTFCDKVRASFASTTEQSIGTITLAEKATRIVGLMFVLNKGDAITTAQAVMATCRIASDDIQLPPSQYPCAFCYDASDGTAVGGSGKPRADFIPVDIPVQGGARITVYATSTASVTGNCDLSAYIAYE